MLHVAKVAKGDPQLTVGILKSLQIIDIPSNASIYLDNIPRRHFNSSTQMFGTTYTENNLNLSCLPLPNNNTSQATMLT